MCNVHYYRKQDHQYGYVLEMLLYSDIFFYYFLNVSEGGQMYATLKLHTSIGSHPDTICEHYYIHICSENAIFWLYIFIRFLDHNEYIYTASTRGKIC